MKIRVHTAFTLTAPDGSSQRFEVGEHSVSDDVATHWFTAAHAQAIDSADGGEDLALAQLLQSENDTLREKLKTETDLAEQLKDEMVDMRRQFDDSYDVLSQENVELKSKIAKLEQLINTTYPSGAPTETPPDDKAVKSGAKKP